MSHISLFIVVIATLSGRPLAVLGVNCRQVLLYNLGLQQLYAGHPTAAFASLLEAVQVFHTNPLLWLRLAETSIAAYNKVVVMVILLLHYYNDCRHRKIISYSSVTIVIPYKLW